MNYNELIRGGGVREWSRAVESSSRELSEEWEGHLISKETPGSSRARRSLDIEDFTHKMMELSHETYMEVYQEALQRTELALQLIDLENTWSLLYYLQYSDQCHIQAINEDWNESIESNEVKSSLQRFSDLIGSDRELCSLLYIITWLEEIYHKYEYRAEEVGGKLTYISSLRKLGEEGIEEGDANGQLDDDSIRTHNSLHTADISQLHLIFKECYNLARGGRIDLAEGFLKEVGQLGKSASLGGVLPPHDLSISMISQYGGGGVGKLNIPNSMKTLQFVSVVREFEECGVLHSQFREQIGNPNFLYSMEALMALSGGRGGGGGRDNISSNNITHTITHTHTHTNINPTTRFTSEYENALYGSMCGCREATIRVSHTFYDKIWSNLKSIFHQKSTLMFKNKYLKLTSPYYPSTFSGGFSCMPNTLSYSLSQPIYKILNEIHSEEKLLGGEQLKVFEELQEGMIRAQMDAENMTGGRPAGGAWTYFLHLMENGVLRVAQGLGDRGDEQQLIVFFYIQFCAHIVILLMHKGLILQIHVNSYNLILIHYIRRLILLNAFEEVFIYAGFLLGEDVLINIVTEYLSGINDLSIRSQALDQLHITIPLLYERITSSLYGHAQSTSDQEAINNLNWFFLGKSKNYLHGMQEFTKLARQLLINKQTDEFLLLTNFGKVNIEERIIGESDEISCYIKEKNQNQILASCIEAHAEFWSRKSNYIQHLSTNYKCQMENLVGKTFFALEKEFKIATNIEKMERQKLNYGLKLAHKKLFTNTQLFLFGNLEKRFYLGNIRDGQNYKFLDYQERESELEKVMQIWTGILFVWMMELHNEMGAYLNTDRTFVKMFEFEWDIYLSQIDIRHIQKLSTEATLHNKEAILPIFMKDN